MPDTTTDPRQCACAATSSDGCPDCRPAQEDCSTCRFHRTTKQPKVVSEVYDSLVEFADEDATVFHCGAPEGPLAGQTVGLVPTHCAAFSPGSKGASSESDAAYARWLNRR